MLIDLSKAITILGATLGSTGGGGPVTGVDVSIDGSAYDVPFVTNAQQGHEDFGNATSGFLQVEMPDADVALTAEQVRAKYWAFVDLDINLTQPRTITIPDDATTPMFWAANFTGQQLFIKTVSGSVVTKLYPLEVYQLLKPQGFPEIFSGRPTIPQAYGALTRDVVAADITAGEIVVIQPDAFHQKIRIQDTGTLLPGTFDVRWDNVGGAEIFGPDYGIQVVLNDTAQTLRFKYGLTKTVDVPAGEVRAIWYNNFDNEPIGELNLFPIYPEQIENADTLRRNYGSYRDAGPYQTDLTTYQTTASNDFASLPAGLYDITVTFQGSLNIDGFFGANDYDGRITVNGTQQGEILVAGWDDDIAAREPCIKRSFQYNHANQGDPFVVNWQHRCTGTGDVRASDIIISVIQAT